MPGQNEKLFLLGDFFIWDPPQTKLLEEWKNKLQSSLPGYDLHILVKNPIFENDKFIVLSRAYRYALHVDGDLSLLFSTGITCNKVYGLTASYIVKPPSNQGISVAELGEKMVEVIRENMEADFNGSHYYFLIRSVMNTLGWGMLGRYVKWMADYDKNLASAFSDVYRAGRNDVKIKLVPVNMGEILIESQYKASGAGEDLREIMKKIINTQLELQLSRQVIKDTGKINRLIDFLDNLGDAYILAYVGRRSILRKIQDIRNLVEEAIGKVAEEMNSDHLDKEALI